MTINDYDWPKPQEDVDFLVDDVEREQAEGVVLLNLPGRPKFVEGALNVHRDHQSCVQFGEGLGGNWRRVGALAWTICAHLNFPPCRIILYCQSNSIIFLKIQTSYIAFKTKVLKVVFKPSLTTKWRCVTAASQNLANLHRSDIWHTYIAPVSSQI